MRGLVVAILLLTIPVALSASPLRFSADGTFRILQLADLHVGEGQSDSKTLEVVQTVLEAEQPALVVMSGDQVSGFAYPAANLLGHLSRLLFSGASWYEQQWRRIVAPLHKAGVRYAAILGNHDGEADLSRRQVVELGGAAGGGLSLTQPGPSHLTGAGNYYLDVCDAQGQQVAARIWMLDSGNRGCGRLAWGWGCVGADTVAWVRREAEQLPRVPSLAFIHVPIPQMFQAWNGGSSANGTKGELVGCPGMDSGFFELAREMGIHAIYSGHDHNNDFAASLDGIRLAYGRKTGYGSYGPTGGLLHGARVIELRLGQDTAHSPTWIRQEDGSRREQADVNAPRPFRQQVCALDESSCDTHLGPEFCLRLREARSFFVVAGVTLTVAAACVFTGLAAGALARHARRGWRQTRGWEQVAAADSSPHDVDTSV